MVYFDKFYLDKDKDIVVELFKENDVMSYVISVNNYLSNNLINNLARISNTTTSSLNNKTVIQGTIPCYIKGDGQRVYIFRLNGTKLANIYPDGKIEVNSLIPAIAKTLMSQTKNYSYSFRETMLKSYVIENVKLKTDLHTHANASLSGDILIALALKHQIRYPLYYIKKLKLILSDKQSEFINKQRSEVEKTLNLDGLKGKYKERRIDDYTFINFADLILNNLENATYNINKIRQSLTLLKETQAVFTNLEKLYLYRYVFTKGVKSDNLIELRNYERIEDKDILNYLLRMLDDLNNPKYKDLTFYEDTLLWIGREYQKRHISYIEISDTTLVKKDESCASMLKQVHHVLPLVKEETGVDIRFLAAIRRIPLTLIRDSIASDNYLTNALSALKIVCQDPYVVGSDFVGEEINDIKELRSVIREIVREVAYYDKNWTFRVHAGENDSLKTNMAKSISLIEESLLEGQTFPYMRIGHGLYCASLTSQSGKKLLQKIKQHNIVLEFQLTSNVRLNNLIDLRKHPLKTYLKHGIGCVMGTDGYGLYGTDSIDEQLALTNFIKINDNEFLAMKNAENEIVERQKKNFKEKLDRLNHKLNDLDIYEYYKNKLCKEYKEIKELTFDISKKPTYPVFKNMIKDLPWDKYPIVIAGGSFTSSVYSKTLTENDKTLLQGLLDNLDPSKVFFVVGHKLLNHEKYIVENNKDFDIYCLMPAVLSQNQMKKIKSYPFAGIRISTESQEMGIYKSFNYEIFERRNSVLFAFDGNSSIANLIQEARNGKGNTYIYIYPNSPLLRAKASSLEGYVTTNASIEDVIRKINIFQNDIGERK